jgi:hypothetical protein
LITEAKSKTGKKSRAEIYQTALNLFVEKGYDKTSMSMIAKILGGWGELIMRMYAKEVPKEQRVKMLGSK